MSYIRTEEVKQKQRETMLRVTKTVDHAAAAAKRKATLAANGTKLGRPVGVVGKRRATSRVCEVCSEQFWCSPTRMAKAGMMSRCCSRKCYYAHPERPKIDKSYMKTEKYRESRRKPGTSEFKRYSKLVHRLTSETYKLHEAEINPYRHPRGRCGVDGAYQLDHIVPVRYGFDNNIAPEVLAKKENLRMLPWKENLEKSSTHNSELTETILGS